MTNLSPGTWKRVDVPKLKEGGAEVVLRKVSGVSHRRVTHYRECIRAKGHTDKNVVVSAACQHWVDVKWNVYKKGFACINGHAKSCLRWREEALNFGTLLRPYGCSIARITRPRGGGESLPQVQELTAQPHTGLLQHPVVHGCILEARP